MSAMTNLKEEAFRNGADYFLDKPISFVEVKNIFTDPDTLSAL
jgi:two-component system response regulator CitB